MESDSEVQDTNALLGYIDVQIDSVNKPYKSDSIIGSQPIALDAKSPFPKDLTICKSCGGDMRQLAMINADLPDEWYDRRLYVLTCIEPKCRRKEGSVRAIRGIKKDPAEMARREKEQTDKLERERQREEEQLKKEEEDRQKLQGLFGKKDSSNPFASKSGGNPFASKSSNPFAKKNDEKAPAKPTFAEVSKPAMSKIEKPIDPVGDLPQYPGYILFFDQEVLDPKNQYLPPLPDNLKIQEDGTVIDDNASISSGNLPKVNPNEKNSEDISKLVDDATFQNFTNVVSFNTGQVVRYELNGQPLLYSSKDKVSKVFYDSDGKLRKSSEWTIPAPAFNPSGERRFELQLMPKMIIDLEKDADIDILRDGMEWGTIIVATDAADVAPSLDSNGVCYVEEWVGVQWEEEVQKGP